MDRARSAPRLETHERFDKWSLVRLGAWGLGAVVAVAAAVAASRSDPGLHRIAGYVRTAEASGTAASKARPAPSGPQTEGELRQLAETVRVLSADRDRLAKRLDTLERNFDDQTGSIAVRGSVSASPARAPLVPLEHGNEAGAVIPRPPQPAPNPDVVSASAGATAPVDEDLVTRTEFGVDLGGSASIDGVRTLWISIKGSRPSLFAGLRPVIAVREGGRPGTLDLRLIAGPMSNAGAAARLCAALGEAGVFCQSAVFDGQRLAVR